MSRLRNFARSVMESARLTPAARAEARRDTGGLPALDPGPAPVIAAHLDWLRHAQDRSATADGGVARHFSLVDGWGASYPETTGYIVPTLLSCHQRFDDTDLESRARRMLDWLVSIQLADGAFQGGMIDETPVAPVTFNTGQILLGLAAGVEHFGHPYEEAMARAADWLVRTQSDDGAWRSGQSPFAASGLKAYDTHVAWGLLEAARVSGNESWSAAALKNVEWALTQQRENGWFASCCLTDPERPLTHTIGYTLRGILEGHKVSGDRRHLTAVRKAADALRAVQLDNGALPGRLGSKWEPAAEWSCLTGNVQIAAVWFDLGCLTGNPSYVDAGRRANAMVRRTVRLASAPDDVIGGVKGSFPVTGDYGRFQLLNWAAKFAIDANLLEMEAHNTQKNLAFKAL